MIATAHQPEHMPWLGFFHKMAQADVYVVMDNVQYRHRYFQNRNRIHGAPDPLWLNVPVRKEAHRYGAIMDVAIDNAQDWRKGYWKSIAFQYGKHPYFAAYAPRLEALILAPHERLVDLNLSLIGFFRQVLGIRTPMVRASTLDVDGAKTDLLLAMCLAVGARTYLSGPSGQDYLDEAPFREAGLDVRYHAFDHPTYPQRGKGEFQPLLSTLDLVMNCGPDSRRVLLETSARAVRA